MLWAQQHFVTGDSNGRSREQLGHLLCPARFASLLTGGFIQSVLVRRYIIFVFKQHHVMKTCWGVEVLLHSFLACALVGGDGQYLPSVRFSGFRNKDLCIF